MATTRKRILDTLQILGGVNPAQAKRAYDTFLEVGALRVDRVDGSWSMAHGGFLERDVIRRAAGLEEEE